MVWQSQFVTSLLALLLLTKRTMGLGIVLLFAVFFAANGIYVLVKGRIMGPRSSKLPQPGKVLSYSSRVVLAVLYFAVATWLALLVWRLGMA